MTTRRSFLGSVTGGAAAAVLAGRAPARAAGKPPLGLQLYSVRNQLKTDVPGTLKQVKAWGFEEVESFGVYGAPIAGALKDAGLRCSTIHVDYARLTSDMAGVLKDADVLGVRTIINPYLPHKLKPFASREEILKAADDFGKWSTQCRAAGKRFGYHIHGQEFGKAPEGTLFDVLAKESGPDVGFEADVFWVDRRRRGPGEADGPVPRAVLVHAPQGHGEGQVRDGGRTTTAPTSRSARARSTSRRSWPRAPRPASRSTTSRTRAPRC